MEHQTQLIEAVKKGDLAKVREFLDINGNASRAKTEEGLSLILLAIYYDHPAIARFIADRAGPLDIFEASAIGDTDRVRQIAENSPELVNSYGSDGFQPLGLACFFGHEEIASLLIASGAEINSHSNNPQQVMPLHSAVAGGHYEITRLLLENGAYVNSRQRGGFTPIHAAAQSGRPELVKLLVAHSADINVRAESGKSALDYARDGGHVEVMEYLRGRGAKSNPTKTNRPGL